MANTKGVTDATRAVHQKFKDWLPFDDTSDFEDASRGLIATIEGDFVPGADGKPIWDTKAREMFQGDCPETVNPSLWRQAQLNNIHGLFKVTDRIYQVRNYDLANITFIEGDTGWVVVDTGLTADVAAASLKLINEQLGERPVTGVIYTHSHVDHYGGSRGIVPEGANIPIVAPDGFLEEAVSENLIAGTTMRRRATYMYGLMLPMGPEGHVDTGLGPGQARGVIGLVAPNDIVKATGETRVIDGVEVYFQFTPDAEAPAEMMFYFPQMKALCTSEVVTHILHNVYTPRGAKVRDSLAWAKFVHELKSLYPDTEVVFASHHWPIWGKERVQTYLSLQRDLYKYLHDETLRLANLGRTPIEIADEIKVPDAIARVFHNRDYYGTVSHNVKAIYQLYFGWYDGNPSNLNPHTPVEAGKRYVEFMGGADAVVEKARDSFEAGDYRWVAQVLNHVVFADPSHQGARELLAAALRQMGYQAESGPWRDIYLMGAKEMVEGAPALEIISMHNLETMRAVPLDLILDEMAVRLNGPKAVDLSFTLLLKAGEEARMLEVGRGVLNHGPAAADASADTVVEMAREDLNLLWCGKATLEALMSDGSIKTSGKADNLTALFGLLDGFKLFFNIVEP
ncbi:MAG: MBL fold metallo-hydrolase [Alphaproteobacteria bacterium]|nr:MAG: MBL fold metallo-hydrolase [Alphaproteobacteria bacterium]